MPKISSGFTKNITTNIFVSPYLKNIFLHKPQLIISEILPERPLGVAIVCILVVIQIVISIYSATKGYLKAVEIKERLKIMPEPMSEEFQTIFTLAVKAQILSFIGIAITLVTLSGVWKMKKWGFGSMIFIQAMIIISFLFSTVWNFLRARDLTSEMIAYVPEAYKSLVESYIRGGLISSLMFSIILNIPIPAAILIYLSINRFLVFEERIKFKEIKKPEFVQCPTCKGAATLLHGKYYCYNCGKYVVYTEPSLIVEKPETNNWLVITLIICVTYAIITVLTLIFQISVAERTLSFVRGEIFPTEF
jgi:hypothetical protein